MKKYKRFVLPLTMVIAFSVIFKDPLMGLLFGWVYYIAQDKKDCCK